MRSNIPPRLQEFPRALPLGTPSGQGVYLTVYPSSLPNTDTVISAHSIITLYVLFCTVYTTFVNQEGGLPVVN